MTDLLVFGGLFLLLDQWSKMAAQSRALRTRISLAGVLQIRYMANRRLLYQRADARAAMVLLWFLALASAVLLHHSGPWFRSQAAMAGLGCALGGAAGNLIDILRRRHVIDFIILGWWPVFNLADVGIVAGLALAFLL